MNILAAMAQTTALSAAQKRTFAIAGLMTAATISRTTHKATPSDT